jgi:NAD-dependent deacetylase
MSIVELEAKHDVTIVTQNVDSLHELAGSSKVIHMHGDLKHVRHIKTNQLVDRNSVENMDDYRPNVVLFGEDVRHGNEIITCLKRAQMFISIGTSNNVYPAANFHNMVNRRICFTVQLNKEETVGSQQFDHVVFGDAEEVVPEYIKSIL